MEQFVNLFLPLLGIYLLIGLVFSVPFLWRGINQVDDGAQGSSRWFKAIIWPGVVAFWPSLLLKWIKS